ncbi:DUF2262 domain-containing protein [Capnocytophaga sp.]|uniref:DUF2262 domain-containing protein n=1 Tax=Capnocytophaga sp. TaxID=44737 RepID=UPI0026DC6A7C|nr:DUF2262 domain-containing protein [Capnocytophaga sp.]MDO5106554.1 DUF2262 domain-containing protein [Capnocytophaga sp.]
MDELKRESGNYETSISYNGKEVTLVLEPDGSPIEETLKVANEMISNLITLDAKAKKFLTEECLDTYNDEIREDDEPELDTHSFENQLVLDEISVVGNDFVLFFYKGILEDFTWMASTSNGENFDECDILT